MAILLMLLVILALAVVLGFVGSRLVECQGQLTQYRVIADFERHKQAVLTEMRAAEERTASLATRAAEEEARLARAAAENSKKISALTERLAPAERALSLNDAIQRLAAKAAEFESKIEHLKAELESVEEAVNVQSFGFYRPRYGFQTSREFQSKLEQVRDAQESLIKSEKAAVCPSNWMVDGSAAKGRKMIMEQVKLMLRAFNGECDAAIAKVKYNNVTTLETRLKKSFEAVNRLGASKSTEITQEYFAFKLEELHLAHELQEKVQAEKEEQRAIKEQLRDEERAQRELEEAQSKAELEAAMRESALEKARRELLESTGRQHEKLEQLVTKLELELKDAIDRKAKAIARAQLTKSGHVYVISNIGSFGDGCFKIGLTRRLDPMERVWELGDASVPFEFDVHAMIFSENAPELEYALHKHFSDRRVNRMNHRKEFFRVSLEEIQAAVKELHGIITFVTVPEAEDYRKTLALEAESRTSTSRPEVPAAAPVRLAIPT